MLAHIQLVVTVVIAVFNSAPVVSGQSQCGPTDLVSQEYTTKIIQSPKYPNNYPSNTYCEWRIRTGDATQIVQIELDDFNVGNQSMPHCTDDYIIIYDGSNVNSHVILTLCGQIPNTLMRTTGPYMTIVFHSGSTNNNTSGRFQLIYSSRVLPGPDQKYLVATTTPQYFTSPNYPRNYPDAGLIVWQITASSTSDVVVLSVLDFHVGNQTECYRDRVRIYDGSSGVATELATLCGDVQPTKIASTGNYLLVYFNALFDDKLYKGFKIQYTSQTRAEQSTVFNLLAGHTLKSITSPNQNTGVFLSNTHNTYHITSSSKSEVVVLILLNFYMDKNPSCVHESVTIYDGSSTDSPILETLCKTVDEHSLFKSSGMHMTVVFQTDSNNNNIGRFYFMYSSQNKSGECINDNLVATETVQYLNSPGYPHFFASVYSGCQWRITAAHESDVVELTVLAYDIDCDDASLYIYNGNNTHSSKLATICGVVTNKTFNSTSSSLTVVFVSNHVLGYSGYRFSYKSLQSDK